jgi:flagellar biosynthetic protein FlhB
MQHGLLWSPQKLAPDFSKVSPGAGFKRLYSVDSLVAFGKSLVKVTVISLVCYLSLKPHFAEFLGLIRLDPVALLPFTAALLRTLAFAVLGVLGVTAAFDYFWQKHRFLERLKMSHQEVKEEMRQSEGDPHVKAKLKQQRMERARRRMMQNVPKATVVVTNPTHYAVALFYEPGEAPVPRCLAKGMDKVAFRIREVAIEAGVPIIEDPPLARALYASVEVEETIPEQHYAAVAKVIGFILNAARKTASPAWL